MGTIFPSLFLSCHLVSGILYFTNFLILHIHIYHSSVASKIIKYLPHINIFLTLFSNILCSFKILLWFSFYI